MHTTHRVGKPVVGFERTAHDVVTSAAEAVQGARPSSKTSRTEPAPQSDVCAPQLSASKALLVIGALSVAGWALIYFAARACLELQKP